MGGLVPSIPARFLIGLFKEFLMYTPQFSDTATIAVRRLAWAFRKSMPKTVDLMVGLMPSIVDPAKVCMSCQDNTKCRLCIFSRKLAQQEQAALAAL
jgi:hypothetical protein